MTRTSIDLPEFSLKSIFIWSELTATYFCFPTGNSRFCFDLKFDIHSTIMTGLIRKQDISPASFQVHKWIMCSFLNCHCHRNCHHLCSRPLCYLHHFFLPRQVSSDKRGIAVSSNSGGRLVVDTSFARARTWMCVCVRACLCFVMMMMAMTVF